MATAQISFASWLRRGLASAVPRVDQTPAGAVDTKVVLPLRFNNAERFEARPTLTLVGPGDIIGFDARAIVRTFPRPDDNDAEAGFFASIEFDQADLPWRYTPASARGDAAAKTDTLRPWFNLIALVEGDEVKPRLPVAA